MTLSEQFVSNARSSCEALLAKQELLLRQIVRARVARDAAAESALAAYLEAIVDHVMRRHAAVMATFPDDFPENEATSIITAVVSGLPHHELYALADDIIHPPLDKLH